MPSLKDIRIRIDSTKSTQKTTSAMKMVSAAKLRKAQQNIVNLRPYAQRMLQLTADVAVTGRVEHPLLSSTETPTKILYVVVASDRGLCGGFNANVVKQADKLYHSSLKTYEKVGLLFVGRKPAEFFKRKGIEGVKTITNLSKELSYNFAATLSETLMGYFVTGEYDEIVFIYNEFKSALTQTVIAEKFLPIDLSKTSLNQNSVYSYSKDLIFEPSPEFIVSHLLQKYFMIHTYRCLAESVASEHGARMTAMENATKNAKEFIDSLTLTYNKLRQAAITKELIEITSGAETLNS